MGSRVTDAEMKCTTCGAGLLDGVCPSCPTEADPHAATIRMPRSLLDGFLDSTRPPPLESDALDDRDSDPMTAEQLEALRAAPGSMPRLPDEPPSEWDEVDGETPTSPESPLAKKSSHPPRRAT